MQGRALTLLQSPEEEARPGFLQRLFGKAEQESRPEHAESPQPAPVPTPALAEPAVESESALQPVKDEVLQPSAPAIMAAAPEPVEPIAAKPLITEEQTEAPAAEVAQALLLEPSQPALIDAPEAEPAPVIASQEPTSQSKRYLLKQSLTNLAR